LPKGSEVIMTSINIPDMSQIVREYGLIPVPVDLDLATTAPRIEEVRAAITAKVIFLISSSVSYTDIKIRPA
jgi:perosamine synthetase